MRPARAKLAASTHCGLCRGKHVLPVPLLLGRALPSPMRRPEPGDVLQVRHVLRWVLPHSLRRDRRRDVAGGLLQVPVLPSGQVPDGMPWQVPRRLRAVQDVPCGQNAAGLRRWVVGHLRYGAVRLRLWQRELWIASPRMGLFRGLDSHRRVSQHLDQHRGRGRFLIRLSITGGIGTRTGDALGQVRGNLCADDAAASPTRVAASAAAVLLVDNVGFGGVPPCLGEIQQGLAYSAVNYCGLAEF